MTALLTAFTLAALVLVAAAAVWVPIPTEKGR
jgi:hypothetical protein